MAKKSGGPGYTIVAIPDVHGDATAPLHPAYQVVEKFILTRKPEVVVILGDFLDMGSLSHWAKGKPKLLEGKRYWADMEMGKRRLQTLRGACGRMEFLMGNHEDWLYKFLEEQPSLTGALDIRRDLGLDDLGIGFTEVNQVLSIGKLNFIHGWYTNIYHARKHLDEMGDHIFYGHTHDHQAFAKPVRAKRHPYIAMSLGCLCDLNPHYLRNKPARHLHGFGIFEVIGDGSFTPLFIPIINGRFRYGGVEFK